MPAYPINYQGGQPVSIYAPPMPTPPTSQNGLNSVNPTPGQVAPAMPYPINPSDPQIQQPVQLFPEIPQQQPVQVFPAPPQQQPIQVFPENPQQQPIQVFPQQAGNIFPAVPQDVSNNSPQSSSSSVLQSPDASYFNGNTSILSPYPRPQQPRGKPIEISADRDETSTKRKSTMVGLGVGAAAMVLTGGLLLPALAGAAVYNTIKKGDKTRFIAYPNTYVYELRAAMGKKFEIKPELIHISRKGVVFDDNELLQKYIRNKSKVTLNIAICDIPVPGSNFNLPYGNVYPEPWTVTVSE